MQQHVLMAHAAAYLFGAKPRVRQAASYTHQQGICRACLSVGPACAHLRIGLGPFTSSPSYRPAHPAICTLYRQPRPVCLQPGMPYQQRHLHCVLLQPVTCGNRMLLRQPLLMLLLLHAGNAQYISDHLSLTPTCVAPLLAPSHTPPCPCSEQRLQFEDWRVLRDALAARCVLATPLMVAQQVVGALLLASSDPAAFAE
jgi:hypothetical protein